MLHFDINDYISDLSHVQVLVQQQKSCLRPLAQRQETKSVLLVIARTQRTVKIMITLQTTSVHPQHVLEHSAKELANNQY